MIKIFKTLDGRKEISKAEKGCWINVSQPTVEEIKKISKDFSLPQDSIQDVLDPDERPRVEFDDEWSMVLMRIPVENSNGQLPFQTIPLGIFFTKDYTLTLCSQDNEILTSRPKEQYGEITDVINFILRLFLRSGNLYLRYLKQINQMTVAIEHDLEKSIKNQELNKLLKMEKCLVYFITSIKANEVMLTKLRSSKKVTTDINEELLDDALIENKQALEMAQIYSDIQSGMMDAFASIISNNLNIAMKKLTMISIILMIPTLISSMFGMNVPNFMESSGWAFGAIVAFSLAMASLGVFLLRNKK